MPFRSLGPADGVHVFKNNADDFAEAEGGDGEVNAPRKAGGWHTHGQAHERGHQSAEDQGREEHGAARRPGEHHIGERDGEGCRGVAAHGHEARVAETELACVAIDQV